MSRHCPQSSCPPSASHQLHPASPHDAPVMPRHRFLLARHHPLQHHLASIPLARFTLGPIAAQRPVGKGPWTLLICSSVYLLGASLRAASAATSLSPPLHPAFFARLRKKARTHALWPLTRFVPNKNTCRRSITTSSKRKQQTQARHSDSRSSRGSPATHPQPHLSRQPRQSPATTQPCQTCSAFPSACPLSCP